MTTHDDQSVMLEIDKLVPWDKNPRHNDEAVDAVALSIQEFGWTNPILARSEDMMVIAGHTRLKAAKKLGFEVVPVRFLDVSEADAQRIAIADNKIGELALWNEEVLSEVLNSFDVQELGVLGFDEDELDRLLKITDPEQQLEEPKDQIEDVDPELLDRPEPKFTLMKGDCLQRLKELDDNSIDAIVCDPPYEIGFMGKGWDNSGIAFSTKLWKECHRVLKHGGHLIAFGGTRTIHRITVAIEDSDFEIRDQICWMQFQGFPKSLNISKQIDRMAGVESILLEERKTQGIGGNGVFNGHSDHATWKITKPATPEEKKWDGWGTGLKPSFEPCVLARKPIKEKSIAENVLKWGTGAINIDGCRFAYGDECWVGPNDPTASHLKITGSPFSSQSNDEVSGEIIENDKGRWPANIFQCPKPARSEKETGLDDLEYKTSPAVELHGEGTKALNYAGAGAGAKTPFVKNTHPTVKPEKLMRWLVRLVTPTGGTVLDPFLGSGTTAVSAILEGFDAIGCELTSDYWPIIEGRTDHAIKRWKLERVMNAQE